MKKNKTSFNFDLYGETIGSQVVSGISEFSMTVGIFGEWGSGKTELLRVIENTINQKRQEKEEEYKLVFPIFFNAWRYEKEPHLIIPLLKTAFYELKRIQEGMGSSPEENILKDAKETLTKVTLSLAAGLAGKFLGFDSEKVIDEYKKVKEEREQAEQEIKANLELEYESIYYDVVKKLEEITSQGIRFIFLVDDLDRCLPENTIKILESIKLFIDIKGCGFILAIDEEIVELGVEHHYKNYKDNNKTLPITGSEYLEKIIQLPFKLPSIESDDVKEFLVGNFENTFKDDKDLLELFSDSLPAIPRKIIRAVNLFKTKKLLARDLGLQDLMLGKIALLELFAPVIYRLISKESGVLIRFRRWINSNENLESLMDTKTIRKIIAKDESNNLDIEYWEKILQAIDDLKSKRIRFSLDFIFKTKIDDENLNRYFTFKQKPSLLDKSEEDRVRKLEKRDLFLSLICEFDKEKVKEAILNEKFEGHILESKEIDEILRRSGRAEISYSWLKMIEPIVSKKDLLRLVEDSGLLERLTKADNE